MKVVSNSSPLCYLRLIDAIHLLPKMFGEILVPEAVVRELGDKAATRAMVDDLLTAVERLRQTSFRASPHLLKTLVDRHYSH